MNQTKEIYRISLIKLILCFFKKEIFFCIVPNFLLDVTTYVYGRYWYCVYEVVFYCLILGKVIEGKNRTQFRGRII